MLHVTEADVKTFLSFPKAIQLVREAYVKLAQGQAVNPPRILLSVPNGASMYFMPAHVYGQGTVAIKAARVNIGNPHVSLPTVMTTIYAYDAITGAQAAEVEGDWLTAIRTAASTAVATDVLASRNARVLGVFGTGREAVTHIPALMLVRDFDRIIVYSRDKRNRRLFAEKMSRDHAATVVAADTPEQVARESDAIVTVTTSDTPVFEGSTVKPEAHVNAIGRSTPEGREVDTELVKKSRVVVDSRPQALATYGDIIEPIREGAIRESDILELGDILIGKTKILPAGGPTLFKAGGLGVLDATITDYIIKQVSSISR
jgi:ornithine cyclodeaminase/alanine dehydrogenase-like protein (mu-crystallin family)